MRILLFLVCICAACAPTTATPGVYDCSSAEEYVSTHITYIYSSYDKWQSPKETLDKGTGDCEDIAILWLYLVYEATGKKGILWIGWWNGDGMGHAWATCGDYAFFEMEDPPDIITYMDYDTAMFLSL